MYLPVKQLMKSKLRRDKHVDHFHGEKNMNQIVHLLGSPPEVYQTTGWFMGLRGDRIARKV